MYSSPNKIKELAASMKPGLKAAATRNPCFVFLFFLIKHCNLNRGQHQHQLDTMGSGLLPGLDHLYQCCHITILFSLMPGGQTLQISHLHVLQLLYM